MANPSTLSAPWLQRPFAWLLAALLAPMAAMPSEAQPASVPPRSYRLEAVELRVLREFGHGQPQQLLVITEGGKASLEAGRPATTRAFSLPAADVVGLLNGLYRLRFFELPAVFGARTSVYLMPDGTLGTQQAGLTDAGSSTVCFRLPGHEKCVRYTEGQGPQELEAWAKAVLADALRRSQPTAPGS